jgi:hypothetical protein
VVVHDVEVDHIGAGGEDVLDFLAQAGEVGGEDGRGDQGIVGGHGGVPDGLRDSARA